MLAEEQFKNDIWWLLQEIKKESFSTPDNEYIGYEYGSSANGEPTTEDQRRIINFLRKLNAIKKQRDTYPFPFSLGVAPLYNVKPSGLHFLLVQPNFDKVYALFERSVKENIEAEKLFSMAISMCKKLDAEKEEEKKSLPAPKPVLKSSEQKPNKDTRYQELVQAVEEEGKVKKDTDEKITAKLAWLDAVSEGNLKRFEKVIRITLEELEVVGINRLTYNKISPEVYQREGFDADEVKRILNKIGIEESHIISVSNDEIRQKVKGEDWMDNKQKANWKESVFKTWLLSDTDLDKYLLLTITTLNAVPILKQILAYIHKKLPTQAVENKPAKVLTPEQKLLFVLNRISDEYQIGTDKGWVEIPASEFKKSGADYGQLRRIMNQFKEKGVIEDFVFIDDDEGHNEDYLYDLYRLLLPPDFSMRADELRISILDPKQHRELVDMRNRLEDMRLNPEKYRKQGEKRAKERKARNDKMYASINYSDQVEKRAWELKWETLQALWLIYNSNGRNMSISVLIKHLVGDKSQIEVDGILEGFKEEGCFWSWQKRNGNYEIYIIHEETFSDTYERVKTVHKTFSNPHPTPEHTISDENTVVVGGLSFNKITGDFNLNEVKGNLPINSQEYRFLKTLLESKEYQCDYRTLTNAVLPERPYSKAVKNDLYTVVRNVKEKLGILPKDKSKNPDIFKNVKGQAYRVMVS